LRRPVESAQYLSTKHTERLAEAGIAPAEAKANVYAALATEAMAA
jgi:hypothetical protein